MRVLVTGATGFTGGHLARALAARGDAVRALVRDPARAARSPTARASSSPSGDLDDRASLERAAGGVEVVYHIAAMYRQAGLPDARLSRGQRDGRATVIEAAAAGGRAPRRPLQHRRRARRHRASAGERGRAAPARRHLPGDEGRRARRSPEPRPRDTGVEVVIARPTGIYGPGDRRLLKLFRGVARRRFVVLGDGRIYYHLTYIDDLVEGFRLCGEVPAAAGRTYILAGGEVTTLNELVARSRPKPACAPPRLHLPVWPFWAPGAVCEALCAPFGIEPPLYRRRVDFFTKSRAFDITRARTELGYAPQVGLREGIRRTLDWYKAAGWL